MFVLFQCDVVAATSADFHKKRRDVDDEGKKIVRPKKFDFFISRISWFNQKTSRVVQTQLNSKGSEFEYVLFFCSTMGH